MDVNICSVRKRRNRNIARSRRRNNRGEFSARLFNIASIAVVVAAKPLAIGAHRLDKLAFDFGREHRAGPVPPVRQVLAPAFHYGVIPASSMRCAVCSNTLWGTRRPMRTQ